jgi:predicted acyl esterase
LTATRPQPDPETLVIDWDVPIPMDDGIVLRADVFRPNDTGPHPVIMTHGPYAKGLSFQERHPTLWRELAEGHPDAVEGSSNRYANWETVDPEQWVPDGYVVIRVDSRGAGRSPGYLDILSPREIDDYAACIEWAGVQPWSNGKVGLLGISYYAVSQWLVAARQPPHLAAICPWEGASDFYREFTHHGGMLSIWFAQWYPAFVAAVQHGIADRGPRNPNTGEPVAGSERLSDAVLAANRPDALAALRERPLLDDYHRARTADLSRITVPVLSATNWAHHLHTRGGFEGYAGVASERKWLEVHGLQHYVEFYTEYGQTLQKRFFGHFLKGEDTGWDDQPPVSLNLRHVDGSFERRAEREWPLARTQWTKFYLDAAGGTLSREPVAASRAEFDALGDGLTFWTEPLAEALELTGPAAASLTVASSTADADVFLTLRVQAPDGRDVTFTSAVDPHGAIALGWLRASLRKLDSARSTPYRPWHTYDDPQPLTPGEPVDLQVELWPTSVIVPAGYRLGVTVGGRDFEFGGEGPWPDFFGVRMRGNGFFVHTDPHDRGSDDYAGTTTLISDGEHSSFLLLPVIP